MEKYLKGSEKCELTKREMAYVFKDGCLRSITILNIYKNSSSLEALYIKLV